MLIFRVSFCRRLFGLFLFLLLVPSPAEATCRPRRPCRQQVAQQQQGASGGIVSTLVLTFALNAARDFAVDRISQRFNDRGPASVEFNCDLSGYEDLPENNISRNTRQRLESINEKLKAKGLLKEDLGLDRATPPDSENLPSISPPSGRPDFFPIP